MRRDSNKGK